MALPTDIREVIENGVLSMATPSFNYNYGPVDVRDAAEWPAAAPQIFLDAEAADAVSGRQAVGKITQVTQLTFRALVPANSGRIDTDLDNCEEDIKRLMAVLETALSTAGAYIITFLSSTRNYRLVRARPGELRVRYQLTWRQSRMNPASL